LVNQTSFSSKSRAGGRSSLSLGGLDTHLQSVNCCCTGTLIIYARWKIIKKGGSEQVLSPVNNKTGVMATAL